MEMSDSFCGKRADFAVFLAQDAALSELPSRFDKGALMGVDSQLDRV